MRLSRRALCVSLGVSVSHCALVQALLPRRQDVTLATGVLQQDMHSYLRWVDAVSEALDQGRFYHDIIERVGGDTRTGVDARAESIRMWMKSLFLMAAFVDLTPDDRISAGMQARVWAGMPMLDTAIDHARVWLETLDASRTGLFRVGSTLQFSRGRQLHTWLDDADAQLKVPHKRVAWWRRMRRVLAASLDEMVAPWMVFFHAHTKMRAQRGDTRVSRGARLMGLDAVFDPTGVRLARVVSEQDTTVQVGSMTMRSGEIGLWYALLSALVVPWPQPPLCVPVVGQDVRCERSSPLPQIDTR